MNLLELKSFVDRAIENAKEHGDDPANVLVSIQVDDDTSSEALWSDDIELTYDGDGMASGCVLYGWAATTETNKADSPDAEGDAVLEGVAYIVNNIDGDTISLIRR